VSRAQAPVFYYDLGSPECYLAAERIMTTLPAVPEWEPVLSTELGIFPATGGDAAAFAARVAGLDLQPLRWPSGWPPDTTTAMLAATYAKQIGRGIAFSLAAFRQAFAGGRDLALESTVLIAGAACEMHPTALLAAVRSRAVQDGLAAACARARDAGVQSLPAIQVERHVLSGPDAVARAAQALALAGGGHG
jgi:2-hydroxychromene-2-carboxylate isomerase